MIERRLIENGGRMKDVRDNLRVAQEQLLHFASEADDARIRALVSETPMSGKEHRDADRHARAMERHRDELVAELARLEANQDDLLDQLSSHGIN
jgi:hypothetical protein